MEEADSVFTERHLTLKEARGELGVSERTIHRWIKSGKLKSYKPGRDHRIPESAIRKVIEESEVYPKVQASLWPEEEPERRNPEPSDAQRRFAKVDELAAEYLVGRAEKHDAEVADPNSPHFANATAAALWLAGVEDERAAWLDWWAELQEVTTPAREDFGAAVATTAEQWLLALGAVLAFDLLTNRTEERIKAMNDTPDQLAARRLEVATAAAEASRKRLEDQREAASG